MNKKQKKVLVAVGLCLIAAFLYPPHHFVGPNGVTLNLGFGWLFSPPSPLNSNYAGTVNVGLLLAEFVLILLLGAIGLVVFRGGERDYGPEGQPSSDSPPRHALRRDPRVESGNVRIDPTFSPCAAHGEVEASTLMSSALAPPSERRSGRSRIALYVAVIYAVSFVAVLIRLVSKVGIDDAVSSVGRAGLLIVGARRSCRSFMVSFL